MAESHGPQKGEELGSAMNEDADVVPLGLDVVEGVTPWSSGTSWRRRSHSGLLPGYG